MLEESRSLDENRSLDERLLMCDSGRLSFVESELQSSFYSPMVLLMQSLYECIHACLSFASASRGSTHVKLSLTSAAMNDLRDELGEGPPEKEISTSSSLLSIASWRLCFACLRIF